MPALVACGRKWSIGSDDFVYPAIIELLLRSVWIIVIATIYFVHYNRLSGACRHGNLIDFLYTGTLVMLFTHLAADVLLAYFSSKGTIIDVRSVRKTKVPIMIYIKVAIFIGEFLWAIAATTWAFDHANSACDPAVIWTLRVAVLVSWLLFAVLMTAVVAVFDPMGRRNTTANSADHDRSISLWKMRCSIICCCIRGDSESNQAFDDIAKIFANFFKGVDIVATDIAAGLVLMQQEQSNKKTAKMVSEPLQRSVVESLDVVTVSSFDETRPRDWMTLTLAAHFMKFAAASYGWSLFVYSKPFVAPCTLSSNCRCLPCCDSDDNLMDDNYCSFNITTIISMTNIHPTDIIYTSFTNRVYEIPFFVCLDHRTKSILISIRGTLSLRDALTDLTAHSECIDVEEFRSGRAHKGILSAAKYILQIINTRNLLEKAFTREPNYRLVITGHSLGAGAASLLAILLKPQYPHLICFAFSPPSLVSLDISQQSQNFICSVVLGQDIVPRLGVITVEQLKIRLLRLIRDSDQPKYTLLANGCWQTLCTSRKSENTSLLARERSCSTDALVDNEDDVIMDVESLQQAIDSAVRECHHHHDVIPLYVTGRILFIDEVSNTSLFFGKPEYNAAWIQPQTLCEILVSPKMILHHLPDTVLCALDKLAKNHTSVIT